MAENHDVPIHLESKRKDPSNKTFILRSFNTMFVIVIFDMLGSWFILLLLTHTVILLHASKIVGIFHKLIYLTKVNKFIVIAYLFSFPYQLKESA